MTERQTYARLGKLISERLYDHLSSVKTLPAPGGKHFELDVFQEPYIHSGGWSFVFDVKLPSNEGHVSFVLAQAGSSFDSERISLELPDADFKNDLDEKYPPEHAAEYWEILEGTIEHIEQLGFKHSSSGDFCVYEEYLPSTCVNVGVLNPSLLTNSLVANCQSLLNNRRFTFSISFSLAFETPNYKGEEECVIVRVDRISEDLNCERLRTEFGDQWKWISICDD